MVMGLLVVGDRPGGSAVGATAGPQSSTCSRGGMLADDDPPPTCHRVGGALQDA